MKFSQQAADTFSQTEGRADSFSVGEGGGGGSSNMSALLTPDSTEPKLLNIFNVTNQLRLYLILVQRD